MRFESGHVYHVYNQGNDRQVIFPTHADYVRFLELSKTYVQPYADILAWCLLPNHFHFMLVGNKKAMEPHQQGRLLIDNLTNAFRKMLSLYSQQFNKKHKRSGSVFRAKTKSKNLSLQQIANGLTQTDYYMNCFYYIHQNPTRHQLVTDVDQWKYSSYAFYANKREKDFCNKQLATELCDYSAVTFSDVVRRRLPSPFLSIFNDPQYQRPHPSDPPV